MRTKLLALLLALLPLVAWAQDVKLPATITGKPGEFVIISATTTDPQVKWFGIDAGLNLFPAQLLKDSKTAVVTALVPGRYRVLAVSAKGDIPSNFAECLVIIGDAPPVVVVPPGPVVPPVNPPQPPAPVTGPRGVVLIRESGSQNTRLADVVRDLHNPTSVEYKYLKAKGHTFGVVDPDQVGSDGRKLIDPWQAFIAGLNLPVVIVSDKNTRALIHKEAIPADTSDANVILEIIKKAGG